MAQTKTDYYAQPIHVPGRGWNVEVTDFAKRDAPVNPPLPDKWLRKVGWIDASDSLGPHLAEFEARALAKQIK